MGQLHEYLSLPSDLATIDPARLAHRGDPCVYCQTPHDDASVGACEVLEKFWRELMTSKVTRVPDLRDSYRQR